MAKYQVTTDQGTYEVETEESSASTTPQNEPQMATGALLQAQGKSIPQQAIQGLMDAPGVYAKEIGGMLNSLAHPVDSLKGMANAAFNRPIDNLVNTAKESFGSYDKAYNTLYNNPIGVTTTIAGIKPGMTGIANVTKDVMTNGLMSPLNKLAQAPIINQAGKVAGNIEDRLRGLPKDYAPIIAKNADEFRTLINPGKGEIKNLEIKGNKDVNTYMKLAAKEQLIIGKDATGKLDTSVARSGLAPKIGALDDVLQSYLDSTPGKVFKIEDILKSAKEALKKDFPNAKEYKDALSDLSAYLNAEKKKFGTTSLSAGQLNQLKRGMWNVSYKEGAPNTNKVARTIGSVAQQKIESIFPDGEIGAINARMGDYLTLEKILENAHGRIIPGGKVGKAISHLTGTAVGAGIGNMIPGVGNIVGPVAGNVVGGFVHDILHDPTVKTQIMANRMKGYKGDPLKLPMSEYVRYYPASKDARLPLKKSNLSK